MAEGDIPYRFRNYKWEVWDGESWVPAGPEAAAILYGFTKVKDIGQGRLVFYAENGDTMTEEVLFYQIEQMDEANRLENAPWWGPEVEAAFGPYFPGHPKFAQALNIAQDLRIPGTPGLAEKKTPGGRDEKYEPGENYGGPPGSLVLRDSNGDISQYISPPTPPQVPQPQQPTFEEEFNRLIFSGQEEKAEALWDTRKRITESDGRMTRYQAADLLLRDNLFKAEEMPALVQALMGPEQTFQEALQPRFQAATRLPGPNGEPGNINVGGFFGPTVPPRTLVPGAGGPGGALGQESSQFPRFPEETGFPTSTFGSTANPNAGLNAFLTGAQPGAAPPSGAGQSLGLNPEDFDPFYATASPEAKAAIEAELERRQGGAPSDSFTQAIQGDLAAVTNAQRTWVQAAAQQGRQEQVIQVPKGEDPFEAAIKASQTSEGQARAEQIRGIPEEYRRRAAAGLENVQMVSAGENPWDAAIRASQTPEGLATAAAIRAVTPEARAAMAAEARASNFNQGPKPMTSADVLALASERRRHQQLLRNSQGRTVFR